MGEPLGKELPAPLSGVSALSKCHARPQRWRERTAPRGPVPVLSRASGGGEGGGSRRRPGAWGAGSRGITATSTPAKP